MSPDLPYALVQAVKQPEDAKDAARVWSWSGQLSFYREDLPMPDENLTVSDGMVVSLDYALRLDEDSEIVDTSEGREPLEFVQGEGQIISGLEQQLYGMGVGDKKNVTVPPADGYGESDPEAYQVIPLDAFPGDMTLEPGIALELHDTSGQALQAYVAEVRPDGVVLDFNHPLAGRTLRFNVRIAGLRPATAEELEHGHVHGAHGHENDYDDDEEDEDVED
jgi:FKBP-type peptidyl-prolyl cis-trans isomerase SlyD